MARYFLGKKKSIFGFFRINLLTQLDTERRTCAKLKDHGPVLNYLNIRIKNTNTNISVHKGKGNMAKNWVKMTRDHKYVVKNANLDISQISQISNHKCYNVAVNSPLN